jgi:SAM-dependent methyltransferase
VRAFDHSAHDFDHRFSGWLSVAAQRRAVRRHLDRAFHRGAAVLELGGGTGEDALYLARRGVRVLLTDGSPSMLARAVRKVRDADLERWVECRTVLLEALPSLADEWRASGRQAFDGAFSNFAALNCVADPESLTAPLASLMRPGAAVVLVVFGRCAVGEVVLQLLRGDARAAFRRSRRGPVAARIEGREFTVHYHRPAGLARAFHPYFRLEAVRGVGIFVPPSAAEPHISRWPRVVKALELLDRAAEVPLARLGDHVLLRFRRTAQPAP